MWPKGLSEASEISANHGADEVIRAAAIRKQTRLCLMRPCWSVGALVMSRHMVPSDVAAPIQRSKWNQCKSRYWWGDKNSGNRKTNDVSSDALELGRDLRPRLIVCGRGRRVWPATTTPTGLVVVAVVDGLLFSARSPLLPVRVQLPGGSGNGAYLT